MEHHVHTCCHKREVKRGLWSLEEDQKLINFIENHGYKNWSVVPALAGLQRCGKSCRLRWLNYLRPDVKLGNFTEEETKRILQLHKILGNKWAKIAKYLPGRTDNEVKNYWNTTIKKRLLRKKRIESFGNTPTARASVLATSTTPAFPGAMSTFVVGDTNICGGGSTQNNNRFSYSSPFSLNSHFISFSSASTHPAPPPPPTSENPNTLFPGFGPFSNSPTNNYQMNFSGHVSNPEFVNITTPSIVENPPSGSDNNSYPLGFHQASYEKSVAPYMCSDITLGGSSSAYPVINAENFPALPQLNNNQDSSLVTMANTVANNNSDITTIMTSDDDGVELLERLMSPYLPMLSSPSSPLAAPQPHASSNWPYNFDVPLFDSIYYPSFDQSQQ